VPAAPATEAPAAGATLAARAFADLGEVSTADELAARLRQRTSEGGQAADDTVQGVIALWACPDEPGTVIGTVVYAGQRALVLITDRSLYVVLDQDCRILATVTVGP
jgi:hypothetical protein